MAITWLERPLEFSSEAAVIGVSFEDVGRFWVVAKYIDTVSAPLISYHLIQTSLNKYIDDAWFESLVTVTIRMKHGQSGQNNVDTLLFEWLDFQTMLALRPLSIGLYDVYWTLIEGAKTHTPPDKWKHLPYEEHIQRAQDHILNFKCGDQSEDHLAHSACRLLMALTNRIGAHGNIRQQPANKS